MIPPLTSEEYDALVPDWAKAIDCEPRCPLVVGLPVYSVLYGPKYSPMYERGTVYRVVHHPDGMTTVGVKYKGGECGSLASYWVPDLSTPEGLHHYITWVFASEAPHE